MRQVTKASVFIRLWQGAALWLTALALGGTALFSLARNWTLDPAQTGDYPILTGDSIGLNLLCGVGMGLLLLMPKLLAGLSRKARKKPLFSKWTAKHIRVLFPALIFAAGCLLGFFLRTAPRYDAATVQQAAARLLQGDFDFFRQPDGYFAAHPYQIGYLLYSCGVQALLGVFTSNPDGVNFAFTVLNSLWLGLASAALLRIVSHAAPGRAAVAQAGWMLLLCLPPLLSCTYQYGNLPGLCCMVWAAVLGEESLGDRTPPGRRPAASAGMLLLISLGVVLKPNVLIAALALALVFVGAGLRRGMTARTRAMCFGRGAAAVLMPLLLRKVIYGAFGSWVGFSFGDGLPMTAYFAMGLQEDSRSPGWFNGYVETLWSALGQNPSAMKEAAARELWQQVSALATHPLHGIKFFLTKLTSQWGEFTFESQWIHRSALNFGDQPKALQNLLAGPGAELPARLMKGYGLALYAGYALGALRAFWRKEPLSPARLALLLTLAGAVAYHLLGEAKSEYAMIYLYPMIALCCTFPGRKGPVHHQQPNPPKEIRSSTGVP